MNYYDQTIAHIQKLIGDNQLLDAIKQLEEELSMPYIPFAAQHQFESLLVQAKSKLAEQTDKQPKMDFSLIESYLFSDDPDRQDYALAMLEKANVRQYMDIIKRYLVEPQGDNMVKTALLHILIDQQINDQCDVVKNNTRIPIELSQLKPLNKNDLTIRQLDLWIESLFADNASLVKLFTQWAWDMLVSVYPITLSNEADIDLVMQQLINIAVEQYDMDAFDLQKRYENIKKAHKIH